MVAANLQHHIPHIVMLYRRDLLPAETNDNLVTCLAVLLLIVAMELVIAHHPCAELCVIAVA